eukprot:6472269-Amphidinium_carterae.1
MHSLHGNTPPTLQEAQASLILGEGWHLLRAPPDGHCLFHCFVIAAHDVNRRDTSVWTVSSVRHTAGHAEGWGNLDDIRALAHEYRTRVRVVPCHAVCRASPAWDHAMIIGIEGPILNLAWWYRGSATDPDGIHFDVLEPDD